MTQSEKHQHWTAIVSNQQERGLSVPQFCKEHDINYGTFHYWLVDTISQKRPQT